MTDISIEDFIKSKTNCELAVNEKVDLPIYYINLERSIGRKELFISQLKKYNIPLDQVTRINAIDGTSLEISTLTYKIYPREITKKKVIACALSHLKAIKTAHDDGCEYAIIMEDDCNFEYTPHQKYKLSDIANFLGETNNIIQLATTCSYKYNNYLQMSPKLALNGRRDGLIAYIITRRGMINVVNNIDKATTVLRVSDELIQQLAKKPCSLTKPYFTYFNSNVIPTTIHFERNEFNYEDSNKLFWDKYYNIAN